MELRAFAAALALALLVVPSAQAQRTRFDALIGCERRAAIQFKRHNAGFRRFVIDRATVTTDRFAERIGNQFIAAIYSGKATYETATGPRTTSFLCLHAGIGRGAVFVYTLAD